METVDVMGGWVRLVYEWLGEAMMCGFGCADVCP